MNIVFTGWKLLHEGASGLLDRSLPDDEQLLLDNLLASYESDEIRLHALLSRVAGSRRFVSFHVLVPGHWTVHAGLAHGIAGEWFDIHGTVGVLLWPLALLLHVPGTMPIWQRLYAFVARHRLKIAGACDDGTCRLP